MEFRGFGLRFLLSSGFGAGRPSSITPRRWPVFRTLFLAAREWYAELGTPKNGGTRLFCLSGNLNKPGVYELPLGYNLKKMIYEVGGGIANGRQLKGGCSRRIVGPGATADQKSTSRWISIRSRKLDRCSGRAAWWCSTTHTCMVKFALRTIKFYQHESCGWCIPCREGTDWLKKTLTRFHAGAGVKKDIDNIQYLAENMLGRTFCPLGDAAAMPIIAFVKKFRKSSKIIWKESRVLLRSKVQRNPYPYSHSVRLPITRTRNYQMPDVTLTVDGKKVTAPAGTLLIEACKTVGHRGALVLLLP